MGAEDIDQPASSMLDFFSGPNKEIRKCAAKHPSAPVPLSLKTRETSALSLKHIFDQIHSSTNRSYAVKPAGIEGSSNNVAFSSEQDKKASYKADHPTHAPEIDRVAMNSQSKTILSPPFISSDASGKARLPVHTELLPHVVHRNEPCGSSHEQMTIFYSGTVNVYDNVPADKANAIMLLAQSGKPSPNVLWQAEKDEKGTNLATAPLLQVHSRFLNTDTTGFNMLSTFSNSVPKTITTSLPFDPFLAENKSPTISMRPICELPHPRKASLSRFLEKRKERMNMKYRQMEYAELSLDEKHFRLKKPCISVLL